MALITIETKINIDDYVTELSDKELIRERKVLVRDVLLSFKPPFREKKSLSGLTNG